MYLYILGALATFPLTFDCSNDLALHFNDRVSSVDSKGVCVRLFQYEESLGASIMLEPNCGADQGCWPNHEDLTDSGLDNGASSSVSC